MLQLCLTENKIGNPFYFLLNKSALKVMQAVRIKNGKQKKFIIFQPVKLNNIPADKLAVAIAEYTIKSFIPCALNFSSSLYVKTTKLVPEINKKFQPNPKNTKETK